MRRFLAKRFAQAILQLLLVGTIVFFLVRLIPGDPARAVLGDAATDEQIAATRAAMHLEEPFLSQFAGFWTRLLQGDLGTSLISGRPVMQDLPSRIGNSLELVLIALAISLVAGIALGRIAATRADKPADHALVAGSIFGISLPVFVIGTLLLLVFAFVVPILPPRRFASPFEDPLTHLQILILPVATLTAASCAVVTRMTRAAMLETLNADHVRTARAKGLIEKHVINRHALRTALLSVVSVTTVELTTLIGSTVLVETIFGWPGMSSLLMNAVGQRDYPVIQAVVLAAATIVILVNLVGDLVVRALDPRAEDN
ncbi:peptide/nickel transport system permease protein [Nonomuraea solani]|uniref:Peptide/nickel transport system permease protein n=1 Tax=Nonomuraea solani TaxID=1144553 RepID=A0A1H5WBQ8_9ACTN|nr:ABC transporter permease [Nonomuraea solani]SEF96237.1 peptide/nickel transport system permease protein [Nonomuraea solani]